MPRPSAPSGAVAATPTDLRTRIGYGVADAGASLSYGAANTWLLFYLVNAIGLAPVAAGAVFIAGRLFDALLDPLMGAWLDRYGGDRIALVRRWALPLGGAFALLWLLPEGSPAWLAALPFMLYSLLFTVVQVPYLALTPDLAPDYDARTELTGVRVAFGIVASLIAAALPPIVVLAAAGGGTLAQSGAAAWRPLGLLFGVATALPYLLCAALLRDPRPRRTPVAARTSLLADAGTALRAPAYRALLAIFVLITLGLMVVSSMLPFYLEGALRLSPDRQTLVLALLFGSAALAFPLWSRLSRRFGKRPTLVAALLALAAADLALVALAPPERLGPTLLLLTAAAGVALAGAMMLPWAILPDLVDLDAQRGGRRREGLLYALFTFAQKGAGSIGVFANGLAASLFGYAAGAALQPAAAIAGIRFMAGPAAALLFAGAALLALLAPIDRHPPAEPRRPAAD